LPRLLNQVGRTLGIKTMDAVLSFLISAGLIGFGILVVVFAAKTASGSTLVWTLMGLAPVVVGLISLFYEIQNSAA